MESNMTGVPAVPAEKKSGWVKWVAIGCGGAVLAVGAFVAVILFIVQKASAGPELVIQQFLADAGAGNYSAAYEAFSAPLKAAQSEEDFAAAASANPTLFQVKDTTFSDRSVNLSSAKMAGTLTLVAGTEMPARFDLVRENDQWKLLNYHIGSE